MTKEERIEYQRVYQKEYRRKKREERRRLRNENFHNSDYVRTDETLLPLKDYPGYYVGDFGSIVSMKREDGPKYLSQRNTNRGYRIVMLSLEGFLKSFQVDRLVLSTFRGYPAEPWLCFCHHKDGNNSNCRLDNLEWIICETTDEYDPSKSHRRGVLRPDSTKERMSMAKFNQSRETIEKAILSRQLTCERRNRR